MEYKKLKMKHIENNKDNIVVLSNMYIYYFFYYMKLNIYNI
jgi:hypothetical protein